MSKEKILIVSRSFYPMNSPRSFRTTELVKEFARQGHDVTLLTPKEDAVHEPFEREYGVTIKNLGKKQFSRFDTSKNGRVFTLMKRVLNRGLNLLFEFPDIEYMWKVKNALKHELGYDLMISISAPYSVHWGALLPAIKTTKLLKHGLRITATRLWERFWIHSASSFILNILKNHCIKRYLSSD